ncbi:MAG: hypothetical protein WA867_01595 [Candidatus Acidiferrales bacterium]
MSTLGEAKAGEKRQPAGNFDDRELNKKVKAAEGYPRRDPADSSWPSWSACLARSVMHL